MYRKHSFDVDRVYRYDSKLHLKCCRCNKWLWGSYIFDRYTVLLFYMPAFFSGDFRHCSSGWSLMFWAKLSYARSYHQYVLAGGAQTIFSDGVAISWNTNGFLVSININHMWLWENTGQQWNIIKTSEIKLVAGSSACFLPHRILMKDTRLPLDKPIPAAAEMDKCPKCPPKLYPLNKPNILSAPTIRWMYGS